MVQIMLKKTLWHFNRHWEEPISEQCLLMDVSMDTPLSAPHWVRVLLLHFRRYLKNTNYANLHPLN